MIAQIASYFNQSANRIYSKQLLGFFLVICTWYAYAVRLDGDQWRTTIISDGVGYYCVLPATFIHHDYTYAFLGPASAQYEGVRNYDIGHVVDGKMVVKYFSGTALALLPFFTTADLIVQHFKEPRDGFSYYYQAAVVWAGVFYLLLGLWAIRRLLIRMGYSEFAVCGVLLLLFLGTNLLYYSIGHPSMSHVYSFGIFSWWLERVQKWWKQPSWGLLLWIGFLSVWIITIRPVNLLLMPFALVVFPNDAIPIFRSWLKAHGRDLARWALLLQIALIPLAVQMFLYYKQTGRIWVDAYGEEGFQFLKAQLGNFWFSWRKGVFVYTPLWFLAPMAWIFWYFSGHRFKAIVAALSFLLYSYVCASWWYWAYGGSFGMRVMVDALPMLAIPAGALFDRLGQRSLSAAALIVVVFVGMGLNVFQTWQYHVKILPYEFMTKEKYLRIFGQTGKHFRFIYEPQTAGLEDRSNEQVLFDSWAPHVALHDAQLQQNWVAFDPDNNYPIVFNVYLDNVIPDSLRSGPLWLDFETEVNMEDHSTDPIFAFTVLDPMGNARSWEARYLLHQTPEPDRFFKHQYRLSLPAWQAGDQLRVHLGNNHRSQVFLRATHARLIRK
jgi:hypothetical protein